MKIRKLLSILALICCFACSSCGNGNSEEENEIKAVADSFSTKYYNWKFRDAMQYSTEECQHKIHFMSSNVHATDIEVLHESEETAEISIGNVTLNSETEARVEVNLKNVYLMDTLGTRVHKFPKITQTFTMKRAGDLWKVAEVK